MLCYPFTAVLSLSLSLLIANHTHLHDIRERCGVHHSSQTRHEVLPNIGGGSQDVCVVRGQALHHCGQVLRQVVLQALRGERRQTS